MLVERRFFLTSSGNKWLSLGVIPHTQILSPDAPGFHLEAAIGCGDMQPLFLGGINGLLNLCRILRSYDDFKYMFAGTAASYDEIDANDEQLQPLNIERIEKGASILYDIQNSFGDRVCIASTTVTGLLKIENLVVGCGKKMASNINEVERKFNELDNKSPADMAAALQKIEKSGDTVAIEIITNFNELLNFCIDIVKKMNEVKARKRSGATAGPSGVKVNKRSNKIDEFPDPIATVAPTETIATVATPEPIATVGTKENGIDDDDRDNAHAHEHSYALTIDNVVNILLNSLSDEE